MSLKKYLILVFTLCFCLNGKVAAKNASVTLTGSIEASGKATPVNPADTIISHVISQAKVYEWYIKEYDASAYIKGTSKVLKKNFLLKYAPDIFVFDKKGKETIMETLVDIHYEAPRYYTQKIKAVTGTRMNPDDLHNHVMQFLNINVYNPTAINNAIVMPFAEGSFSYYRYHYEGSMDSLGIRLHKIRIEPKHESLALVTAYAYIVDEFWSVASLEASGKQDFADFKVKITMGVFKNKFLLPVQTDLYLRMKLLGNHVENEYTSVYEYSAVSTYQDKEEARKKSYDISEYFNVKTDSVPIIKDELFWSENRPVPLSEEESDIYEQNKASIDSLASLQVRNSWTDKSWRFTKMLIQPRGFQYRQTNFQYSGFLNPLKVGYSPNNGFSYSQKLKLERHFKSNDKTIGFYPDVGYVFDRKELFVRLPVNALYYPQKMGMFSASVGNGNQGLNSRAINEINEQLKDSAFKFENFNLEYYKDYYAEVKNRIEIVNGLQADMAVTYHYRKPVVTSPPVYETEEGTEEINTEDLVKEIVDNTYRSFEPSLSLTWNPGQYYRMEGRKKIYVGSYRPTFSLQYARGIKGVFKSDGNFERIEGDIQQRIPLHFLTSIQYYAGAGVFTNSDELYFVDFTRFARRNFPESWDDKIGGVFNLLDYYWYNASKSYVQGHLMYESPFIFLRFIKKNSRLVVSERLYFSQLYLPGILPAYTEVGYGIGNFILNAGVFVSFEDFKYQRVGFKFAFELFN